MAYQKLQVGRAIAIIPDDTYNFPNPALKVVSSVSTAAPSSISLTDTTVDFVALGVQLGDLVSIGGAYSVVEFITTNTLTLADAISAASTPYSIYKYNYYEAAVLQAGSAGDINVETVGGDIVQFFGISAGQFIPVQVLKVLNTGTTVTNIIALW